MESEDFAVDPYRQRFSLGSEGLQSPTKVLNVMSFCLELHSSAQLLDEFHEFSAEFRCAAAAIFEGETTLTFASPVEGWPPMELLPPMARRGMFRPIR